MFSLEFVKDYLVHRFTAKTRHGVHSPFVYKLIDTVIYEFRDRKDYGRIEKLRKDLLSDRRWIDLTDLGAGSSVNKNRRKQVREIARHSLKSPRLAQLIYRLAADLKPRTIVELGTCLGITSLYLSSAAPDGRVHTIEGCPETAAIAGELFERSEIGNVILHTGSFDDILPGILESEPQIDLVYVDGNHREDATLKYFEQFLPKLSEQGMMIFDDIYWSPGMKNAWSRIKADPRVTVTIDLFWIGLVYIRKGQVKEDFKIRY